MNQNDYELLERYSEAIYGCSFEDLSDSEERMLIEHVRSHEPEFQNHRGL